MHGNVMVDFTKKRQQKILEIIGNWLLKYLVIYGNICL